MKGEEFRACGVLILWTVEHQIGEQVGGQGLSHLPEILAGRVVHLVSLVRMLTLFSSDVKTPFMKFHAIIAFWFLPRGKKNFSTGCDIRCRFFVAWLLANQQIFAIDNCANVP